MQSYEKLLNLFIIRQEENKFSFIVGKISKLTGKYCVISMCSWAAKKAYKRCHNFPLN